MTKNPTTGVYYTGNKRVGGEYKITFFKGERVFRVYKQFYDENGQYHRITQKTKNIIDYDNDLKDLIQYIENELIGKDHHLS